MDTEDRDHFKTIGSAQVELLGDWRIKPTAANSSSGNDQAYCLRAARIIFACYRRDDVHDPEMYASAVGAVLSEFPRDIVDLTADPRTGIAGECKWLPSVAEIRQFCQDKQTYRERLARYAALPPPIRRASPDKPASIINLFVPDCMPRYAEMIERHKAEPGQGCYFEAHTCADGETRNGICVPLHWWENGKKGVKRESPTPSDAPLQASDALLTLLKQQDARRDVIV